MAEEKLNDDHGLVHVVESGIVHVLAAVAVAESVAAPRIPLVYNASHGPPRSRPLP